MLTDQPRRKRVSHPCAVSSKPATAITLVTSLVMERTDSCSPVREIHRVRDRALEPSDGLGGQ
jgi:hypothetical protein